MGLTGAKKASLERFQEKWAPQPGEPVFRFENATKQKLIEPFPIPNNRKRL
jgi:hypothetical protein